MKNTDMALEDVSTLLNHNDVKVTKKFYIKQDTKKIAQLKDMFKI